MKQITELTEQEILALTTDQINKMIQFKMAEAGIKILTKPVEPTYRELPKKTELLYKVEGIDYLFTDKAIADDEGKALQGATSKMMNTNYIGNSYTDKKVVRIDPYTLGNIGKVSEVLLYNSSDAELVDEILKENKANEKVYKELLADYNKNEEEANYIRVDIWEVVKNVTSKHNNMNDMKYQYERYLDLAEGNKKIAMNFLKKAYTIDDETEAYVQGKQLSVIS